MPGKVTKVTDHVWCIASHQQRSKLWLAAGASLQQQLTPVLASICICAAALATTHSHLSICWIQVRHVPGGVGRNIAEALSLLMSAPLPPPALATLVGNDAAGSLLLRKLQELR